MKTQQNRIKKNFIKWINDPLNWKWGVVYYNKNDMRLFPRTGGFKWAVNFAHWDSFAFGLGLAFIVLAVGKFVSP